MPQVAARISSDQEKWLKDYFKTKSAGAEFILPWAVDTFFRAISTIKGLFSNQELKVIIETHKDFRLLPEHSRLSYLMLRVNDACDLNGLHDKYNVGKAALNNKLSRLDDTQATALMVWSSAYWVSPQNNEQNLDIYITR